MVTLRLSRKAPRLAAYKQIEQIVATALHQAKLDETVDLTIMVKDDQTIRQLNKRYRQIDTPTDVLSFASDETDPETGRRYLGDVVISFEQMQTQSAEHQISLECEFKLLVIHGVLHLCGFDHGDDRSKQKMRRAQNVALTELGCATTTEVIE